MSEDPRWLDGNALGGLLQELFGAEMTAAPAGEAWALPGSPSLTRSFTRVASGTSKQRSRPSPHVRAAHCRSSEVPW
jgi:hypothetical protein